VSPEAAVIGRRWWVILSVALPLGGCATVMGGKHQRIQLETDPPGAAVTVDGRFIGHTPIAAPFLRSRTHRVQLDRAGCHPFVMELTRRVSGWFFMNFALGGAGMIVGAIVDSFTGAMYSLLPEERVAEGRMMLHAGNDRLFARVALSCFPPSGPTNPTLPTVAPPGSTPAPPPPPPPAPGAEGQP
jgi:hypothetical protein